MDIVRRADAQTFSLSTVVGPRVKPAVLNALNVRSHEKIDPLKKHGKTSSALNQP